MTYRWGEFCKCLLCMSADKEKPKSDEDWGDVRTEFDDATEPFPIYVICSCGLHEIDIRKDPYEQHREFEEEMGL